MAHENKMELAKGRRVEEDDAYLQVSQPVFVLVAHRFLRAPADVAELDEVSMTGEESARPQEEWARNQNRSKG